MDTIYSKFGYNMELETNAEKSKIETVLKHVLKIAMSGHCWEEKVTINIILLSAKRRKKSLTFKIILLQLRDLGH